MKRAYYETAATDFAGADPVAILGALTTSLPFAVEPMQRAAWIYEIRHLQTFANSIPDAHIFLEFCIPRMGRRVDALILLKGIVFVLEYKVGKSTFSKYDIDQTLGYALDLKNFHETTHDRRVIPILIATEAATASDTTSFSVDSVGSPVLINAVDVLRILTSLSCKFGDSPLNPTTWISGRYKPTPTIIEAAQALYRGHDVEEISRSEAGAENLSKTGGYINQIIEHSKLNGKKSICFVTGVPGSGKTLAGLNIANSRMKSHADEHAVFLSGNGPLVDVLREALTIDTLSQAKEQGMPRPSKAAEYQKACAFIQNIHHFRDENLSSLQPPIEKVVVFDEAQRAWNMEQTSRFMREKRGLADFTMSEPEFLLSVMDRHADWCAVVCLVGGGQEINTGEAGIREWLKSLQSKFPHWDIHISEQIVDADYAGRKDGREFVGASSVTVNDALHLAVSIRSFRAEHVSSFVGALISGDLARAKALLPALSDYPIVLTRDLSKARKWLRERRRGCERAGLLASSNALRLKPNGIFMKAKIDPPMWFLASSDDVRSSDALEDAGSEFDVQGLELDWTGVCWDANFRRNEKGWEGFNFKGTKWQRVADPSRNAYLVNSYRVLLTRARQGMVIVVPEGDDEDRTRLPDYYDPIYEFLLSTGIPALA